MPSPAFSNHAELADRLHSLAIHLLRAVRATDDESGLSGPRLSALSVIRFRAPISLTELAAAEHVTTPTMTRLVQALETEGLVRRETDASDRRAIKLHPTPRGARVLDSARQRRLRTMEALLDGFSADETRQVEHVIELLESRVGKRSGV
jgi:DNA-binding MarR family transcriptional regulator